MMTILLWILLSVNAKALQLEVVDVQYRLPPRVVSCGLLKQREKERLKVYRELHHILTSKSEEYEYWLKKLFVPMEDWAQYSTEVILTIQAPEELQQKVEKEGFGTVFLVTSGPGFIWHSYANQLPPKMSVEIIDEFLEIRYFTFLNAVCTPNLTPPTVDWIDSV